MEAPMKIFPSLLGLMMLSASLLGCDDDPVDVPPFTVGDDQCTGTSDMDALMTLYADGAISDAGAQAQTEMGMILDQCARIDCLAELLDSSGAECMRECMGTTNASALTAGCNDCFIYSVTCGIDNCVTECLDSSSTICLQCTEANCNPEINACIGFDLV